jgi:hypothetical protein
MLASIWNDLIPGIVAGEIEGTMGNHEKFRP